MAYLKVANSTFERAFGTGREDARRDGGRIWMPDSFMAMLSVYLHGRKEWPARAMYSWIRSGGKLCAFTCREDLVQPVIDMLMEKGCPFVLVKETTGNTGFLIRDADSGRVKAAADDMLKAGSGYCEITTGEMAGIIYRRAKIKDRSMLVFEGLSEEEVYYLQEEAGPSLPGMAVGVDRMPDGTYTMTCHGESAFGIKGSGSFGTALMEAVMLSGGECADAVKERGKLRREYLKARASGFPDRDGTADRPVWIVGRGDCYVKRTRDGFEAGHAEELCGEVFLVIDAETGIKEEGYDKRLGSALSRITGHRCLYEEDEVLEYFRNKKDQYRGMKETGLRMLVSCASGIVSGKEERAGRNWAKRMTRYRDEMCHLLETAGRGAVPPGYGKNDILRLRKIIRVFGLDMERSQSAIDRMRGIAVLERDAGPRRIDIEEKLAALHERHTAAGRSEPERGRYRTGTER